MEALKTTILQFAFISESAFTTIMVAVVGFISTIATVGYKYKKDKPKPEDQSKVLFDQVNEFIEQQKQDRDDLRKELTAVKVELGEVRAENKVIREENQVLREENQELREELEEVKKTAATVAAVKVQEDKING